ncbi:MAG: histidinol dehydrogenase [Chloroflexi bacterium]|nr:histidinol dehydrogenase [Chloroflexota bacterium]
MRLARGAAEARDTVLRRVALEARELPASVREEIRRVFGAELDVEAVVERILRDVKEEGDAAVLRYNEDVDGVHGTLSSISLEVSPEEIQAARPQVDPPLVAALEQAADRIRAFHQRQLSHSLRSFREDGIGQLVRPLERVGIYVPGTRVVYPSTVLMTAIPAQVAGVTEIVMTTPALEDASVSPLKLVAAEIAGVARVFRAGGVQGIAAMAYGTETVPRVDKVCGPGNIFVTLAKRKLYGEVGIDGLFGPSETLVIADGDADPSLVAADLLAGAEHDELAVAALLTTSEELADAVGGQIRAQLDALERASVARASLEARGGIAVVASLEEAVELASEFAPEHLCLHVTDAERLLERVRNAGCVFVGAASVESIGDYTAGPSHVMPTGGSAAYGSPLGVHDFLKVTSVVALDDGATAKAGPPAAAIARAEGLTGHAAAVERRLGRQP